MKNTILIDINRCSGCYACAVACMDQYDLEVIGESQAFRRIYRMESNDFPEVKISYISMACMHCEDAPCLMGCPTGAIQKDEGTGAVLLNKNLCIGCHSCALACPFGVPRFGEDDKMYKCVLCAERVEYGLEPACVRVCPTRALKFGPVNQMQGDQEQKASARIVRAVTE